MQPIDTKVLGIPFHNQDVHAAINRLREGGLLVVPAAPALVSIKSDKVYYQSLLDSDVAIPDSGYMVLLWNLFYRPKLPRISGLEFILAFLEDSTIKQSTIYLVNPTPKHEAVNIKYLQSKGFDKTGLSLSYNAPMYTELVVEDSILLADLQKKRPNYILLNIGGKIQEKLGAYLKANLDYRPTIICTGAAIAFLTGQQANIPMWADRFYLGWLIRCIDKPKQFIPRYLSSFKLLTLMLRYGASNHLES